MNISNIKVGETFKNWKALCEALDVEPKPSGKARVPQTKQFKQYFDWDKQGQKITITEIKKVPSENDCPQLDILIMDNDDEKGTFSKESTMIRSRLKDEMKIGIEESSLQIYENIIKKIEGNTLRDLIAKSIINQLYLQLTEVGTVGFGEAWWVTDAELYRATGMISDSHYYAIRNPMRFCNKMPELTDDNFDEVLDHIGVNRDWLVKQRSRVLKYLTNDLHLITYYQNAYFFIMKTTRIRNQTAYTNEEYYYPTLDELEWINKDVIPKVMRQHVDANGNPYKSLVKIKQDGKIREFYQEWMPMYINENLPTGWGYVNGVYKCHRIGFSKDVIEYAVNNHMNLRCQEKEILNEIANCLVEETRQNVTNNRNEQSEKRHSSAVNETSRCSEEIRLVRCRESYIGVGFVVNRECHSNEATYTDYTKYNKAERTVVSKIE